ncbi:hypothetical protein FBU30_005550 [Linnemannia zychae]|nr:hypothetical protein FBU30_005550 [Linnemannia zychae]
MSKSFNGIQQESDHDNDDYDTNPRHDDHDDDGSKENTRLLQQDSSSGKRNTDRATNRRNSNRSMVHSLYASPKHFVSQRRQASVPGSPVHDTYNNREAAPLYMNNVAGLWDNDKIKAQDDLDGKKDNNEPIHRRSNGKESTANARSTSSLILDDVTPPLPWKETTDKFASTNQLSASQRFSMEAIADGGAFAMPSNQHLLSDSQSLMSPSFMELLSNSPNPEVAPITPTVETKKRRWGPKSQKNAAIEPESEAIKDLLASRVATADKELPSSENAADSPFISQPYNSPATTAPITIPSESSSGRSSPMQTKSSQTGSGTFGLSTLSGTGHGLVSGLTTLKNSIMIPALPSASSATILTSKNNSGDDKLPGSLTGSQSSLLGFLEDSSHPSFVQHQHSPQLLHHASYRSTLQQTSPRSSSVTSSSTESTSKETPPQQKQSRRKRVASQASVATQSLSAHESELQQQIQRQSQLSMHKVDLCKELLSLYSRRNSSERRQEEAAKAENFEEADAATRAIDQVQERISQLEGIYADTDRSIWECKKRQDELGKKICEFHPLVLQELDEVRLKREAERNQFESELRQRRDIEVEALQNKRDEIEKDRSDIALEQDFLGKNQSELKERIDEETRLDQDLLDEMREKRKTNRSEIEMLTKKLEQLNQQDKTWALEIATVQQRIRTTEEQFSEKSKEIMHDKKKLDHRISDVQKRNQRLDQQEALLQKAVEEGEIVQKRLDNEIQAIVSQQRHLESVRKMFGDELSIIQRLREEEEGFREKEAGWTLSSNRWMQDLTKIENRIKKLADKVAENQRAVIALEEDIEGIEKRVNQVESLKVLAVQRRDFKQASVYSSELTKLRENLSQHRKELEIKNSELAIGSSEKDHVRLQNEYDDLKISQKEEQLALFKEIETVANETIARLIAICSKPNSNDTSDTSADKSNIEEKDRSTAAEVLIRELRLEIESVLEVSRIRYGREMTVPETASESIVATAASVASTSNPSKPSNESPDKKDQREALEKDIQAAVAEEDYTTAAKLQEQLDAL